MQKTKFFWCLIFLCLTFILFIPSTMGQQTVTLEYFYSAGCPDCAQTTPIINAIEQQYEDQIVIERLEVSTLENWERWDSYGFIEVPAVVINNETKIPKEEITKTHLETLINDLLTRGEPEDTSDLNITTIDTPFGKINISGLSLPILAIVLGGLDSINPCSFWVLLFLLSLLLYVRSRRRMLLIGGIFIFFSGFIYFLFMTALVGIFLITAQITIITIFAGLFALFLGGINIKDFFFFKKGPSLSIPESKKPELFQKMRTVVKTSHLPSMIAGTILLAIFANTYELFCTMGLPMVFTRILTLHNLLSIEYSLYVLLYNIVYIIPLLVIVVLFTFTLGRFKLSDWHGRVLKLFSGLMMFFLGLILVVHYELLTNVLLAAVIPVIAALVTGVVVLITKKYPEKLEES